MSRWARLLLPALLVANLLASGCSPRSLMPRSSYTIWSSCGEACVVRPGGFLTGDVPDTFEVRMSVQAAQSLGVGVLTNYAYANFISCFRAKIGSDSRASFHCLTEAANLNGSQLWTGSDVRFDFEDAEGCAGYLMVVAADADAAVKITPDEQITYKPAPKPTGMCTQNLTI